MAVANKPTKRFIMIAVSIVLALIAVVVVLVYMFSRPNQQDYTAASGAQLKAVASTRDALAPAVNEYLAAWKKSYNESSQSGDTASKEAQPEFDAFKKAQAAAVKASSDLRNNRAVNDGETGTAIRALTDDYAAEIAYFAGLVDSYPQYSTLFSDKKQCAGIFIGETSSLVDRKQKLDVAAKDCLAATGKLKQAANVTYTDYAKKIERRVRQMQTDAGVTARAETNLKKYETQVADFQKKFADATARGASEEELFKLADEIKAVNADIEENKAQFDFASKRYLTDVKEIPALFQAVYGTNVPAKLKAYSQLNEMRTDVLRLVLQAKTDA